MQSNTSTSNRKPNKLRMWSGVATVTKNRQSRNMGERLNENVLDGVGVKIRIGSQYQAVIPDFIPKEKRIPDVKPENQKALPLWIPNFTISDAKYNEYLTAAEVRYQYNWSQSLGILYWHHYNFHRAMDDIRLYCPNNEEWTSRDMAKFERAYRRYGKAFNKIQWMLPNKSLSSIMVYYYGRKKHHKRNGAKMSLVQHVKNLSMK